MNEIRYRGKGYRQQKAASGEARSLSASTALNKMMPFLTQIGVTRVASLTGMTRIGIPVANAVRPGLCGPSVTHGKGLTEEAAMASACGEAIERYHAFEAPPQAFLATYRDLEKRHAVIPSERLPLSKNSLFNPTVAEYWTLGWDIVNQQEIAVPLSLASMATPPVALNTCSFQCTSNGFAHGSNFLEALCQALLEVIERDAITCTELPVCSNKLRFPPTRVDPESVEYPVVKDLLARLQAADFEAAIFDCSVDTGVATYKCSIAETRVESGGIYYGMGASLDPCTAMVRATSEAIQGAAVYHTGTRDVCFRDDFYYPSIAPTRKFIDYLKKEEYRVDARKKLSEATGTFEGDITVCLQKLAKAGITQVIVFDLTVPDCDGSVVKVFAPGLEGCHDFHIYTPGDRALRYIKGVQN